MSPEKLVCGILLTLICRCTEVVDSARARVTLHMTLSNKIQGSCDESAYKVDICAKEFTTECHQKERYLQDICAPSSVSESISFDVQHVESSIEISGTVLKVGDKEVIVLRTTEFLLTDRKEIDVTSFDLLLIIRFRVGYVCLRNYFGKLCNRFCDQSAEEHICDEWGSRHCKQGYFMDIKSGKCRKDQCLHMSSHCLNNGTCVNNQGPVTGPPKCLCPNDYTGARCEHLVISTTTTIRWTSATSEPNFELTSTELPWHSNTTNFVAPVTMTAQVPVKIGAVRGTPAPLEENHSRSQVESPVSGQEKDVVVAKTSQTLISNDMKGVKSGQFSDSKKRAQTSPVVQTTGIATGLLGVLIISITLLLVVGVCLATWYVHLKRRKRSTQSGESCSSPAKFPKWMITCAPKPLNLIQQQQQFQVTGDYQPYLPSSLQPPPPPPPAFTPTYFTNMETGELVPDPMATPLTVHHQPWRSSVACYPWDSNQPVYGQTATHLTTLPRMPRGLQLNTFLPNSGGEVTSVLDPVRQSACYGIPSHFASSMHRQSRPPGLFFSNPSGDAGWAGSQLLPVSAYGNPPLVLPQSDYHAQSPVATNEFDVLGQQVLTNSYLHMPTTTATYSTEVEASQQQVYGSSRPDLDTGGPDEVALLMQSPVVGSFQSSGPYLNPSQPFQFVDNHFQRTDI